jgi:hypothetical protein
MMTAFQRVRLIWLVLLGLLAAATGCFAVVSGYDAENGCALAAKSATPAERAAQIHGTLKSGIASRITTAVTETAEGTRVVSSSELRLRPAQRAALQPGDVDCVGVGHAEATGVNAAEAMGLTPTGTAASRPICPGCADTLQRRGVTPLSPLKRR